MFRRALLPAILAIAPLISGCVTQRAAPTPSAAVVAARAGAGHTTAACGGDQLADVSPTAATFGFDLAEISEAGQHRLARAAAWLKCNPTTEVVILPGAESRGKPDHERDVATRRGQAVQTALRAAGVQNVLRIMAPGAADPVQGPHLVIQAADRGW